MAENDFLVPLLGLRSSNVPKVIISSFIEVKSLISSSAVSHVQIAGGLSLFRSNTFGDTARCTKAKTNFFQQLGALVFMQPLL